MGTEIARKILPVRKMLVVSILAADWTRVDSGDLEARDRAYFYDGPLIENRSWIAN